MTQKVYVVTDLGPGDGGKGGVVHKVATMMKAHTIVKRGGAQGSHGVRTSRGEEFAFSQWGCGTLDGIPTHCSEQFIIHPEGLLNEAQSLKYQMGVHNPFGMLTVDERCLVATPYHGIASRILELSRGSNPRGTVGTGVGAAYRMHQKHPGLSILARDLKQFRFRDQLLTIRELLKEELRSVIEGEYLTVDLDTKAHEVGLLYDDRFFDFIVERFNQAAESVQIVDSSYLPEKIFPKLGAIVVETSHGVLTDRLMGFHPHTSAIRTLPRFSEAMLRNAGFSGQIVNIGVTRAYAIRHGAGPLPTHDPEMVKRLLPGSHKQDNRWQGKVRVGPLDFVLLRYAVDACGGAGSFDGLAITCFDQIVAEGEWRMCQRYTNGSEIAVRDESAPDHLGHQAELARHLYGSTPEIESIPIDQRTSREELYELCASTIHQTVGIQVRMVAFGPTESDKMIK